MWELGVITVMGNCRGIRVITVMKLRGGLWQLGVITVIVLFWGVITVMKLGGIMGIGANYGNWG